MKNQGKCLAIWGVGLQTAILTGSLLVTIAAIRLLGNLEATSVEIERKTAFYENILVYAMLPGALALFVGWILALIALHYGRYRALWFKKAMWILSIIWLLNPPIGTLLGLKAIIYLVRHENEFVKAPAYADAAPTKLG